MSRESAPPASTPVQERARDSAAAEGRGRAAEEVTAEAVEADVAAGAVEAVEAVEAAEAAEAAECVARVAGTARRQMFTAAVAER